MTLEEKFKLEHPELNIIHYCPDAFGYIEISECPHNCGSCWRREVPEDNGKFTKL